MVEILNQNLHIETNLHKIKSVCIWGSQLKQIPFSLKLQSLVNNCLHKNAQNAISKRNDNLGFGNLQQISNFVTNKIIRRKINYYKTCIHVKMRVMKISEIDFNKSILSQFSISPFRHVYNMQFPLELFKVFSSRTPQNDKNIETL